MARRIAQSACDACRASICYHVHALAFLGPKAQFDGARQLAQADLAGGLYRGNLHTNWQTVPYAEGRAKGVWSSGLCPLRGRPGRSCISACLSLASASRLCTNVLFATCLTSSFRSTISFRGQPQPITSRVVYGLNSEAGTCPDRLGSTRDYVHAMRAGRLSLASSARMS